MLIKRLFESDCFFKLQNVVKSRIHFNTSCERGAYNRLYSFCLQVDGPINRGRFISVCVCVGGYKRKGHTFTNPWPVSLTCAQPYHPGSGSHGQLFRPYWGSSAWHSRRVNPCLIDPSLPRIAPAPHNTCESCWMGCLRVLARPWGGVCIHTYITFIKVSCRSSA